MFEVIVRHFQGRISDYLSNEDKIIFLEKRKLVDMLSSNTHIGSKSNNNKNQKKIIRLWVQFALSYFPSVYKKILFLKRRFF